MSEVGRIPAQESASIPTEGHGAAVLAAAKTLNGSEYGSEGSSQFWAEMKTRGLVAVFGGSDDLMEFRGAIEDEIGCYGGGSAWVTSEGLFEGDCDCKHAKEAKRSAVRIKALWGAEPRYSWTYETTIPHATFEVVEDGDPYCRGIVFALSHLAAQPASPTPRYDRAAGVNQGPDQ